MPCEGVYFEFCCNSLIVSPFRLVRNVPLSWRPWWRSRIGADSDEWTRVEARGGVGARGGGDLDVAIGGVDGRELSPGEAVIAAVSEGWGLRSAARQRGPSIESGDGGAASCGRCSRWCERNTAAA